MSPRHYLPIAAGPSPSVPRPFTSLYPGDCLPTPRGPAATARVVQQIGNDPPQFEIAFEACKVTARIARDSDEATAKLGTTPGASPRTLDPGEDSGASLSSHQ